MKRELERVDVHGEHDARQRAWSVVAAAFSERKPVSRPSHWPRVAAVAIASSVVVAAALSSPGRAVLDEIREVVGVERAQPALFSLPAPGTLLVASDAGVWVVHEDGSRRLLGDYREATWSPFGRFVAAAGENELVALEPDGEIRWTLSRPGVRSPRWAGSETDTRIAYVDRTGIRVVAGDGTRDRLVVPDAPGPLAWRPGGGFALASVLRNGNIALVEADSGRVIWRARPPGAVSDLEWTSDGRQLAARLRSSPMDDVVIYRHGGMPFSGIRVPAGTVTAAAARPGSHGRAVAIREGGHSRLSLTDARSALLSGPGHFEDVIWSPDGRWLLVTWPAADQWVFIRAAEPRRIRAVSNIAKQFRSASFPRVEGWYCAP
ncbi:MAG: hypothetical protein ACR2M2_01260 [Gaiellaceae bacterium]